MKTFSALLKRNVKLFFKDKGLFFTSLITPLILLVLYATFLANVYRDSLQGIFTAVGVSLSEDLINGAVGKLYNRFLLLKYANGARQGFGRTKRPFNVARETLNNGAFLLRGNNFFNFAYMPFSNNSWINIYFDYRLVFKRC